MNILSKKWPEWVKSYFIVIEVFLYRLIDLPAEPRLQMGLMQLITHRSIASSQGVLLIPTFLRTPSAQRRQNCLFAPVYSSFNHDGLYIGLLLTSLQTFNGLGVLADTASAFKSLLPVDSLLYQLA